MMETKLITIDMNVSLEEQLAEAGQLLKDGQLVAFPTETVYGLGANGLDEMAAKKIYTAKGRPSDNPLILHIAEKDDIIPLTEEVPMNARVLIDAFWPGPLTLVVKRSAIVPRLTAGGLDTVAVRMPDADIARALIRMAGVPIAAPSANLSGRPSPTTAKTVAEDMDGRIAMIVDGGACHIGVESTIVDCTSPVPTVLRPGGITVEMLTDVLGAVEIDKGLTDESVKPKAPGMKYRHYAPEAETILFEGETERKRDGLIKAAMDAVCMKKCVGALVSRELAERLPADVITVSYGDKAELASLLYDTLRGFDEKGADVIYLEGVDESDIGLAVMNRLRKASGNRIVTA